MFTNIVNLTIAFFNSNKPTFTELNKGYLTLFLLVGILSPLLNITYCIKVTKIYVLSFIIFGAFFVFYRARENYLDRTLVLGSLVIFITAIVSVTFQFNMVLFVRLLSFIIIFPLVISILNSGVHYAIRAIHLVYVSLAILILVEYILLTFNFSTTLQSVFFCASEEIRDYRGLHNRFSELTGLKATGLNSIFLGAQFANIILVQSFFLSVVLFITQKKHGFRYFILGAVSLALLILSPTVTGLIVLSLTSLIFLIIFFNYISQKVISFLLFTFFLFFYAAYWYLMVFHGMTAVDILVFQKILEHSEFPVRGILLGMGSEYSANDNSSEIQIVNMVGLYGVIASGVLLYMFISTIYNRKVVSFSNMDGKINALLFTPLFISLIHYNTFLSSGVYSLTMLHLAIAVVLKKQRSST